MEKDSDTLRLLLKNTSDEIAFLFNNKENVKVSYNSFNHVNYVYS